MPVKELKFPTKGVERRGSLRSTPDSRGSFPAVWASNVRVEANIDRRMRGGSRPGLTKYTDTDQAATINDMVSINLSSATGTSEVLFVLAGNAINTVVGGTTTPGIVSYLTDEGGVDYLLNEEVGDNKLVFGDGTAPTTGFLVTGQQQVFAVTTSGVTKMDPKTGEVNDLPASSGTVPTSCTFGAVYRDRLCLSGDDNAIYMSKQGDYTDWNYGADSEDSQRAVPFQLALGADVGATPTAMIPFTDSHMICATARTLWVVQGDPTADGGLRRVSENIGIIGPKAWVRFDQTIVFLSEDGLHIMSADGSNLKALSPDAIPEELRDIDLTTKTVSLGWDQDRQTVHIYVKTNTAALTDVHWAYEMAAEAFWPMELQTTDSPEVVCQHDGELLLACNDDFIRKVGGSDDDNTPIESHVVIGPVRLGPPNSFGRLVNMHSSIATGSGTVNWKIVTGDTAETAADNAKAAIILAQAGSDYSAYVQASGSWTAGRATMSYPRTRAVWVCLWLQSDAEWAFEGISIDTVQSGKWRGA